MVCDSEGAISDNDSIIFFNFRPDRAREITRVFVDPEFDGFNREFFPLTYVCTTEYDATMPNVQVAFPRRPRSPCRWWGRRRGRPRRREYTPSPGRASWPSSAGPLPPRPGP